MLPELLVPLAGEYQFFNLFRYITFRTGGATITAGLPCHNPRKRQQQKTADPTTGSAACDCILCAFGR